jgi:hypothetical protein
MPGKQPGFQQSDATGILSLRGRIVRYWSNAIDGGTHVISEGAFVSMGGLFGASPRAERMPSRPE